MAEWNVRCLEHCPLHDSCKSSGGLPAEAGFRRVNDIQADITHVVIFEDDKPLRARVASNLQYEVLYCLLHEGLGRNSLPQQYVENDVRRSGYPVTAFTTCAGFQGSFAKITQAKFVDL